MNVIESEANRALLALLAVLKQRRYHHVTPTPATHARVLSRADRREAADLRDVLGWSLPFRPAILDEEVLGLLRSGEALTGEAGGLLQCRYRVSTLDDTLFLHSAYPTLAEDAVFFGPDSYRFADLIRREFERWPAHLDARLVDIGAGAGVGAIVAANLGQDMRVTMTDVNPQALRLARINARAAGIEADYVEGADLAEVASAIDIALANPPYIMDSDGRDYRDGGDLHGARIALDMAEAAVARLSPSGRLILYTGSAIIGGADPLHEALADLADRHRYTLCYREIDPDVFGEELEKPFYHDVERIALIAATMEARSSDAPNRA